MPIFDVERKILNDNASFSSSKVAFVTSLKEQIEKLEKTQVDDPNFTDIYLEDLCNQIEDALPQGTLKTLLKHPGENNFLKVKRIGYTENTKTFDATFLKRNSSPNVTTIQDLTSPWQTPMATSTPPSKGYNLTPYPIYEDAAAVADNPGKYVSLISTNKPFNETELNNGEYYERFNLDNCFGVQLIELGNLDLKDVKDPEKKTKFGMFDFDKWDQGGIKEKDGTYSMDYGYSTFEIENEIKLKNYFLPAKEYLLFFKDFENGKLQHETLFSKKVESKEKSQGKFVLNFGPKKDIGGDDITWLQPGLLIVAEPLTQKQNTFIGEIVESKDNIKIEVKTNGNNLDSKNSFTISTFPRLLSRETVNFLQTKYKEGLLAKRLWFQNSSGKVYSCTSVIYSFTRQLHTPLVDQEFTFKTETKLISGEKSVLADQEGNLGTTNPGNFTRYKLKDILGNKTKKALNNGNKKDFYNTGFIIGVNKVDFDSQVKAVVIKQDFELLSNQFSWPNTPKKGFNPENPTDGTKKYIEVVFKMSHPSL